MLGFAPLATLPLAALPQTATFVSTDAEWIRVPEEVRAMSVAAEPALITIVAELDMKVLPVYKTQTVEARLRKP